ncbi:hypothetical protein [Streptomyces sp. CBMA123]|uniref:hypothetical protein n=1 Tax=Streptomyces sp. CBMA123 TaxID=1896313 RepID=UPI001661A65F|nr:hypothetical protein [Streptomyces sp. CBMA123]
MLAIPLQDGTEVWGKTGHDLGYCDGLFATLDLRKRLHPTWPGLTTQPRPANTPACRPADPPTHRPTDPPPHPRNRIGDRHALLPIVGA